MSCKTGLCNCGKIGSVVDLEGHSPLEPDSLLFILENNKDKLIDTLIRELLRLNNIEIPEDKLEIA